MNSEPSKTVRRRPLWRSPVVLIAAVTAAATAVVVAAGHDGACTYEQPCTLGGAALQPVVLAPGGVPEASSRTAEVFGTIRPAGADGAPPPIPPSETWPAQ